MVLNLILDGNFYFASINERQPRVPFEVLHFSSNYYRRENGIDPEWKITDPVSYKRYSLYGIDIGLG